MNVFYSYSFSKKVEPSTGQVSASHRSIAEKDITRLRDLGHEVYCDMEQDDWRLGNTTPPEVVRRVIANINLADVLVARLSEDISAGMQWEIGYALGIGKRAYVLNDQELSFWNQGLVDAGLVRLLQDDFKEIGE